MLPRYKDFGPGQHLRFVTLVILDLSLNMLIFYMTTALLKIARKLNLYKLLQLYLLLMHKKQTSYQSLYKELDWMTLEKEESS